MGLGRVKRRRRLSDGTSYSFKARFRSPHACRFKLEMEPENVILVASRLFGFSHSLGQKQTSPGADAAVIPAAQCEARPSDVRGRLKACTTPLAKSAKLRTQA